SQDTRGDAAHHRPTLKRHITSLQILAGAASRFQARPRGREPVYSTAALPQNRNRVTSSPHETIESYKTGE
ncbi:hypothetical protein AAE028_36450, partial [Sinorhizobium sp. CB9]|uniref:hypothetical protein n=1 Tax=Sinorhizobium sp. CB9 TaxID=3056948 RepID=UPI003523CE04